VRNLWRRTAWVIFRRDFSTERREVRDTQHPEVRDIQGRKSPETQARRIMYRPVREAARSGFPLSTHAGSS
jgi:hypothetical protein